MQRWDLPSNAFSCDCIVMISVGIVTIFAIIFHIEAVRAIFHICHCFRLEDWFATWNKSVTLCHCFFLKWIIMLVLLFGFKTPNVCFFSGELPIATTSPFTDSRTCFQLKETIAERCKKNINDMLVCQRKSTFFSCILVKTSKYATSLVFRLCAISHWCTKAGKAFAMHVWKPSTPTWYRRYPLPRPKRAGLWLSSATSQNWMTKTGCVPA